MTLMSVEKNQQNIGEALTSVRILKSEISRLYALRKSEFSDTENEEAVIKKFIENTVVIDGKLKELSHIKTRIENTNHETYIDTPEGNMTLSEAIRLIGTYRSMLAEFEKLRTEYDKGFIYITEKKVKTYYGTNQKDLEEMISNLEMQKGKLDAYIQSVNWKTMLK